MKSKEWRAENLRSNNQKNENQKNKSQENKNQKSSVFWLFFSLFSSSSSFSSPFTLHSSLCLLSAGLLILSHPPYDCWFLAWVALVPLLYVVENRPFGPAFGWGYLTGVFYFFGMFWWIGHVTVFGMILLNLYLALYVAMFAGGLYFFRRMPAAARLFLAACLWVVCEFLRATLFSGFGWAALGHSQYRILPIIQMANITGAYGVSFLLVMVNVVMAAFIRQKGCCQKQLPATACLGVALLMAAVAGYGFYTLKNLPRPSARISVAVVQPNVAQEQKWDPFFRQKIMENVLALSRQAAQENPDLMVWPESVLPLHPFESPVYWEMAQDFARAQQVPLLLGTVTEEDGQFHNSALLLSSSGDEDGRYDKLHLVPFGEYIPLRPVLGLVADAIVPIQDMAPGKQPVVFHLPLQGQKAAVTAVPFSTLICFEDTTDQVARRLVGAGAGFLVNITNDGWFGHSKAALLHLEAAVFQAVANQRFLVRAANTGVSALIGPGGKIVKVLKNQQGRDIGLSGFFVEDVGIHSHLTRWTRDGNIFVYFCVACLLLGVMINCVHNKSTNI